MVWRVFSFITFSLFLIIMSGAYAQSGVSEASLFRTRFQERLVFNRQITNHIINMAENYALINGTDQSNTLEAMASLQNELNELQGRMASFLGAQRFQTMRQEILALEEQLNHWRQVWLNRSNPYECSHWPMSVRYQNLCQILDQRARELGRVPAILGRADAEIPDLPDYVSVVLDADQALDEVESMNGTDGGGSADCLTNAEGTSSEGTGSGSRDGSTRAHGSSVDRERLQRLIEQRNNRREELRLQELALDQPATLPDEQSLINQALAAIRNPRAREGVFADGFDPLLSRVWLDALRRTPPITERERQSIVRRWDETIHDLEAIANDSTITDPMERVTRARDLVVSNFLSHYNRDQASPLEVFLGTGGNCQTQTYFLIAAFSRVPGLVPREFELGIQNFQDHVQPVLIPRDRTDTRVMELINPHMETIRRGDIYRPTLATWGMLEQRTIDTGIEQSELLMAAMDSSLVRPGEVTTEGLTLSSNQTWGAADARAVYAPNQEIPAHARVETSTSLNPETVAHTGSGHSSIVSHTTSLSAAEIRDAFRGAFPEFFNAHPNATLSEINSHFDALANQRFTDLTRQVEENPSIYLTPQFQQYRHGALSACAASQLAGGAPCDEREYAHELERMVARHHPEIINPAGYVLMANEETFDPANPKLRTPVGMMLDVSRAVAHSRSGDFNSDLVISDSAPISEIWDQLLDPSFLAPDLSIDEMVNHEVSVISTPRAEPTATQGTGVGGGSPRRRTRYAGVTALSDYNVPLDDYIALADAYIRYREGHRSERTNLLRNLVTYSSTLYERNRGTLPRVLVCGQPMAQSDREHLLNLAQILGLSSIPCP